MGTIGQKRGRASLTDRPAVPRNANAWYDIYGARWQRPALAWRPSALTGRSKTLLKVHWFEIVENPITRPPCSISPSLINTNTGVDSGIISLARIQGWSGAAKDISRQWGEKQLLKERSGTGSHDPFHRTWWKMLPRSFACHCSRPLREAVRGGSLEGFSRYSTDNELQLTLCGLIALGFK